MHTNGSKKVRITLIYSIRLVMQPDIKSRRNVYCLTAKDGGAEWEH